MCGPSCSHCVVHFVVAVPQGVCTAGLAAALSLVGVSFECYVKQTLSPPGFFSLRRASLGGQQEMVALLLDRGADIARVNTNGGSTALM